VVYSTTKEDGVRPKARKEESRNGLDIETLKDSEERDRLDGLE
jgi:hypothetical protein